MDTEALNRAGPLPAPQTVEMASNPSVTTPPAADKVARLQRRASIQAQPSRTGRHAKRLTLNFPIAIHEPSPEPAGGETPITTPATTTGTPAPTSHSRTESMTVMSPKFDDATTNADDPSAFLTALAAQERKVLELREELHRAESELLGLKRQWAMSERTRKRGDVAISSHSPAAAMANAANGGSTPNGSPSSSGTMSAFPKRPSREMGRRSSIMHTPSASLSSNRPASPTTTGRPRTVFQSRHARTLSLLASGSRVSPNPTQAQSLKQPQHHGEARKPMVRAATSPAAQGPEQNNEGILGDARSYNNYGHLRSATNAYGVQWRKSLVAPLAGHATNALVKTGQQMATDVRSGIWTFFEDIRQATVGDDVRTYPANGVSSRQNDALRSTQSEQSAASKNPELDPDDAFWSEFGIDVTKAPSPEHTRTPTPKPPPKPRSLDEGGSLLDFDDNWDMWEAMPAQPQPPSSTVASHGLGISQVQAHTPSSSTVSTQPSKRAASPSTATTSPRTSISTRLDLPVQNQSLI